jgi:ABC-type Fe3+-siderophore transport system permease subunit
MSAAASLRRQRTSNAGRMGLLVAGLLSAVLVSMSTGPAAIPLHTLLDVMRGSADATTRAIVLDLRMPRSILACVVGGGLAMSGATFQALLRNPLAEPYILGVSGGAAVGAVLAIVTGLAVSASWGLPAAAFGGALLAIALVFFISARVGRGFDTRVMLLAGVVIGAFFNAVILLLLTYTDIESFRSAVFWMMGSLGTASWTVTAIVAIYTIPLCIVLVVLGRAFDLLALGEETALFLGVRVEIVKFAAYAIASLIVAATVALCGVIGFIGLIVPHALRLTWGGGHRFLLPGCFLAGGAFLLLADTAARTIASPAELPVGVVTALVGVPLFVLILTRSLR